MHAHSGPQRVLKDLIGLVEEPWQVANENLFVRSQREVVRNSSFQQLFVVEFDAVFFQVQEAQSTELFVRLNLADFGL